MNFDIDHVDPKWKEGQDYQLVCGLDVPQNFCEREERENQSKSNRFLPWRVARDELGAVPLNPGDLCQFLDPDTNEWVLEKFLGDWWFEKTWKTCGPYLGFKISAEQNPNLHKEVMAKILKENPNHQKETFAKLLEKNPNHQSEAGKIGGARIHEQKDENGKSLRAQELGRMGCPKKKGLVSKRNWSEKWMDPEHPELGFHPACILTRKQKKLNLPWGKEHRVRVE